MLVCVSRALGALFGPRVLVSVCRTEPRGSTICKETLGELGWVCLQRRLNGGTQWRKGISCSPTPVSRRIRGNGLTLHKEGRGQAAGEVRSEGAECRSRLLQGSIGLSMVVLKGRGGSWQGMGLKQLIVTWCRGQMISSSVKSNITVARNTQNHLKPLKENPFKAGIILNLPQM